MKKSPWTATTLQLLEGKPQLVALAKQLAAIDQCWRRLLALPKDPTAASSPPSPRLLLSAACVRMSLALDAIWDEGVETIRRSIANSVGPAGSLDAPSGVFAYVDLTELAIAALRRIQRGLAPPAVSNRLPRREAQPSLSWSPDAYAIAVAWIDDNLSLALADEIATHAIKDLMRQRTGPSLTAEEVKARQTRKAARAKLFESGWKLTDDAASILELLPKAPTHMKFAVLRRHVGFKSRKLKMLLSHLRVLGLVKNKMRDGYCISGSGPALLRFRSERA